MTQLEAAQKALDHMRMRLVRPKSRAEHCIKRMTAQWLDTVGADCQERSKAEHDEKERNTKKKRVAELTSRASRLVAISAPEADRHASELMASIERFRDVIKSMSSQLEHLENQINACKKQINVE